MFEQRRHIATLDGLRGFAALIVVWLHMTTEAFKVSTPYRGYLAVDFFFILSGFVIAGAYEQRLLVGMPFSEFVRIRLIRLYPLIVLAIVCGFSVKLTAFYLLPHHGYVCDNVSSIIIAGILGIFLLPSHVAINPDFFPLDSPLWSLMFELWANLLYAFIASLANARQLRAAVWALAICGGIGLIPSVKLFGYLYGGHTIPEMGVGFARVGWGFFAGVVLHGLLTAGARRTDPAGSISHALHCIVARNLTRTCVGPVLRCVRGNRDITDYRSARQQGRAWSKMAWPCLVLRRNFISGLRVALRHVHSFQSFQGSFKATDLCDVRCGHVACRRYKLSRFAVLR
jgi:peptidoglycan/LPS O-acetylase OafA/YrhL